MATKADDERLLIYTGMLQAQELIYAKMDVDEGLTRLTSLITEAEKKGYIYHAMYGYAHLASYRARNKLADSLAAQRQMVRLATTGGFRELALPVATKLYTWYDARHDEDSAELYANMMLEIVEKEEQSKNAG